MTVSTMTQERQYAGPVVIEQDTKIAWQAGFPMQAGARR